MNDGNGLQMEITNNATHSRRLSDNPANDRLQEITDFIKSIHRRQGSTSKTIVIIPKH